MLRATKPQPTHPDFMSIKLSVQANNWMRYSEFFKEKAIYNYGDSGKALRTGNPIPLRYAPPDRNALFIHQNGRPIPGQYIYKREPLSEEQAVTYGELGDEAKIEFMNNCPLQDSSQAKFDRDDSLSVTYVAKRIDDDNAQHALMAENVSESSAAAIKLHDAYNEYRQADEPWNLSLLYYKMLADIHQFGDASTKFMRTSTLINTKHDPSNGQTFDEWVNWLNEHFAQFQVDFESEGDHRGYIHCGELKSFLFLHGTDRAMFRPVYDEQLRLTPTGRFNDPDALIKLFQQYYRNHMMSVADPVSTQGGGAYPAATNTPRPVSQVPTPASKQYGKKTKLFPEACPHCLKTFGKERHGHDPAVCSNNPHKAAALSATTLPFSPPRPSTSDNSAPQTDRLDRLEQSLQALIGLMTEPAANAQANTAHVPFTETITDRLDRLEHVVTSFVAHVEQQESGNA